MNRSRLHPTRSHRAIAVPGGLLLAIALLFSGCSVVDYIAGEEGATALDVLEQYRQRGREINHVEADFEVRFLGGGARPGGYSGTLLVPDRGNAEIRADDENGEQLFRFQVSRGWLEIPGKNGTTKRLLLRPGVPHLVKAAPGMDIELLARLAGASPQVGEEQDVIPEPAEGSRYTYLVFDGGVLIGDRHIDRENTDLVEENFKGGGASHAQRVQYHDYRELPGGLRWPAVVTFEDPTGRSSRYMELTFTRVRSGTEPAVDLTPSRTRREPSRLLERKGVPFE